MTREQVVKGLHMLLGNGGCVYNNREECTGCPYEKVDSCCAAVLKDAITLMKAQEEQIEDLQNIVAMLEGR